MPRDWLPGTLPTIALSPALLTQAQKRIQTLRDALDEQTKGPARFTDFLRSVEATAYVKVLRQELRKRHQAKGGWTALNMGVAAAYEDGGSGMLALTEAGFGVVARQRPEKGKLKKIRLQNEAPRRASQEAIQSRIAELADNMEPHVLLLVERPRRRAWWRFW